MSTTQILYIAVLNNVQRGSFRLYLIHHDAIGILEVLLMFRTTSLTSGAVLWFTVTDCLMVTELDKGHMVFT